MIYITRKEQFNAAHRLFKEGWTDEENLSVFGLCSNPNWHGHNYTLLVTVKCEINPQTGFLINLKDLSKIINEKVIIKTDHKNINIEVDFMKGIMTSTENLAVAIWNELNPSILALNAALHCVKLYETDNNFVEYFGV